MAQDALIAELVAMGFEITVNVERGRVSNSYRVVGGTVVITLEKGAPYTAPESKFKDGATSHRLFSFIERWGIQSALAA